jgi:polysaccharide biosynthesis/export protein
MRMITTVASAAAIAFTLACPAAAQLPDTAELRLPPRAASPAVQTGPLLDIPIDRTEYRLGPGDVLELSVFGSVNEHYSLAVTPEGSAVVPQIGVARVLGMHLDQAEAVLRAMVGRLYRNVDVRLTLSRVRTFRVFVVGDVPEPGTRTATAATRVSEMLPPLRAGGVIPRNILLRRASGDSVRLDLLPFFQGGDLRANPALQEGDALVVPVVDETVQVVGRVSYPGKYEYREGETLSELLRLVNSGRGFLSSAADSVWLVRFDPEGRRQELRFSAHDVHHGSGTSLLLRPFDAVFVPELSDFRRQPAAMVVGQVARPGAYPIRPDTTTIRELVAMAGGFTADASLVSATLRRQPVAGVVRRQRLESVPDTLLSRSEQQVLALAEESGGEAFVVVDFVQLFLAGGNALDQVVQDGDVITVPRHRNEVIVQGAVLRPGIVPYVSGIDYREYIRRAGGLSRGADPRRATVIRAGHGNLVLAQDVHYLQPGDQLVIPFRARRTLEERLDSISSVVGLISSTILTFALIRQM